MSAPKITTVQQHLMDTLADLRSGKIKPDQAKAVAHVASVLVDTAKVQVDYLRVTGQKSNEFLGLQSPQLSTTAQGTQVERTPGRTVHRLGD